MHRVSGSHSTAASSSRSKRSSSPGSRSSRSGGSASRSIRSRSRRRSPSPRGRRPPSPRGRRRRSRSRRRSPSPRGRRRRSHSGRRSPRRSPSPRRSRRRHSLGRHSHSPGQQSPSQHSECSVEQNLQATVGDDCYGVEIRERKRLSDRLDSPVGSPSDVDRNPSSLFDMSHDKNYHIRDVFVYRSDNTVSYNHLQDQLQETHGDGELLRKSSYLSNDRRQEHKHFHYDRDDRLFDKSVDPKDFLLGTQKYCKRSFSRSPSPAYLDEDFHELEFTRRKREEVEVNRSFSHELPGNSYTVSELTKPVQTSEPQYLYRPEEAPAMPKKSILKKRVEEPSVQPCSTDSFSLDVENFLKQFNKNVVTESAASKEFLFPVHDWKPHSGQQQNASFEQNSDNFLIQKNDCESALEPTDQQSDFLLPHERASQYETGFSHILGMMGDAAGTQEERRHSFPDDIEDEEKFLYGNGDDSDFHINSLCAQKLTLADGKETMKQKVTSLSFPSSSVKVDTPEESLPEYEKIHDLFKTIGLDIGEAEICKLAARTQERLHGKKQSRSPDHHLVASHKSESREGHRSRSDTRSPESSRKYSLSPPGSFAPCKDMSSVSISDSNESKAIGQDHPFGTLEQSIPPVPIIPSAPPCLPNFSPSLTPFPWYGVPQFTPFTATQLPQSYPSPTMPPPGLIAYGNYMTYAASGWPIYTQPPNPVLSGIHTFLRLAMPVGCPQPNLKAVGKGPPGIKKDKSVLERIPSAAPDSKLHPQLSLPALRSVKERISDEKKRVSRRQKVTEEKEKLKAEQETRQKQLYYLRIELNRLSRLQEEMLPKKRKEEDPLLVEVSHLKESVAKKVAELETKARAAEKKKSELDKVAQILGINVFEKSRKLSSENKESLEKNMLEDIKNKEGTPSAIKS